MRYREDRGLSFARTGSYRGHDASDLKPRRRMYPNPKPTPKNKEDGKTAKKPKKPALGR